LFLNSSFQNEEYSQDFLKNGDLSRCRRLAITENLFFRSATQSNFKQIKAEIIVVVDLTKEDDRREDGQIVSFGKKGDGNLVFSPLSDEEFASWSLRQYFLNCLHKNKMKACVVRAARLERNQVSLANLNLPTQFAIAHCASNNSSLQTSTPIRHREIVDSS